MADVLLVSLAGDSAVDSPCFLDLRSEAQHRYKQITSLSERTWLATIGPGAASTLSVGPWTLIGEVFHRRNAPVQRVPDSDPHAYEKKMIARFWGGYVGTRLDSSGSLSALLRDPSGALDCVYWTDGPLTVVASDIPAWLVARLRPEWSLDVPRIEAALHDPYSTAGALLLRGPKALDAGAMVTLPCGDPVPLWRPDWIYRAAPTVSDEAAAHMVTDAVDEAVSCLGDPSHALAVEISGGLDSSIVAASVTRQHRDRVRLWLNGWGPDPSADERPWIDLLAAHLAIPATCVPRAMGTITYALLDTMPQGFRPGLAALDGTHDADWAQRFRSAGVDRVLTGKGGDGLFIQPADTGVFVDLWRDRGWRALLSPALMHLARWNERSVWTLIGQSRQRNWSPESIDVPNGLLPPRHHGQVARHPWLEGIDDLGPTKRRQILALVQGLGIHGPSLQTQVVEARHPLLSQPVVEACLALPAYQLTLGRRDRALAREAFSDRLPAPILDRRSKGEMTAFYGRMIADGLDVLRPWLLEGRLAGMGLIDRPATEALLARGSLAWRGGYVDIMVTAAIEGWVRAWEQRLA